jgi:hypothetical protein
MKATHAYVGFNAAGEPRAFCSDDSGCEMDTAHVLAEWAKMGRRIRMLPIEQARRIFSEGINAAEMPK